MLIYTLVESLNTLFYFNRNSFFGIPEHFGWQLFWITEKVWIESFWLLIFLKSSIISGKCLLGTGSSALASWGDLEVRLIYRGSLHSPSEGMSTDDAEELFGDD